MKRILFVSFCARRSNTTGITGKLIDSLSELDRSKYEIELFDTNYFEAGHKAEDFKVVRYYSLPKSKCDLLIKKVPFIRSKYASLLVVETFKKVIKSTKYDLVAIYHIPEYADRIVKLCNINHIKVLMFPWGSDILCCSSGAKRHIQIAFENTDYVGGVAKSNCLISAHNDYGVPESKFIYQKNYIPGVAILQNFERKKSRIEMHEVLNIPYSDYNIVCGYNGYSTHNHNIILDAIINNESILPNGYQLIFPMTYGATEAYYENIKKKCGDNRLNAIFLRQFITNEQMAYLHLITDLFINVQDSDCGNAFMIEALFAKNQIITGKWLHYEQFEQFGVPYHMIDRPEELSKKLAGIFLNQEQKSVVPEELIELYRVPKDYVKGSYWTNIVDKL